MDKHHFLVAGAVGAAAPWHASAAKPSAPARKGPGLLTVAGAIGRINRGALDPALDQLLVKHKTTFDKAFEFDAALLAALPAVTFQPTLEYDEKAHQLSGPLLGTVIAATGVVANEVKAG